MQLEYVLPIYGAVLLGLLWSLINLCLVKKVKVTIPASNQGNLPSNGENDMLNNGDFKEEEVVSPETQMQMIVDIGGKIKKGANAFLFQEYLVMLIFIVIFGIIVLIVVDIFGHSPSKFRAWATIAFIIGSLTSIVCGWIGMAIAVEANFRTTFEARYFFYNFRFDDFSFLVNLAKVI